MTNFTELDIEEWDSIAPIKKKRISQWDVALRELENGKIIKVDVEEPKGKRAVKTGLTRGAKIRGFAVEFRDVGDTALAIKKTGKAVAKAKVKASPYENGLTPSGKRRGRPPKHAVAEMEESIHAPQQIENDLTSQEEQETTSSRKRK